MLSAALLGADGHEVTVLERDGAEPPDETTIHHTTDDGETTGSASSQVAGDAFSQWERPGVRQFRLGHLFLPRFYFELRKELPEIAVALEEAGATKIDFIEDIPESITGGHQPGDDRFTSITGRRPMIEAAIAAAVEDMPGIQIRRGEAVAELLTDPAKNDSEGAVSIVDPGNGITPVPVIGVRTASGEDIDADLVVDASGRASSLDRLLVAAGGQAPETDEDDSGFVYFGRTFSSTDGSLPGAIGAGLQHYESLSTLTLPADHGTWFCGIIASSGDKALRRVRDPEVFEKLWRSYPLIAHWHDGEPFGDDVIVMAGLEDRIRHFMVDGDPIATGVVAVGDSWASTNPSVGRGASMGLLHSIALRDHLREQDLADPVAFARTWWERTDATVKPWFDDTVRTDQYRLEQIRADIDGRPFEVDDASIELAYEKMSTALLSDPEVLRGYMDIFTLHRTKQEVLVDDGLADRVRELVDEIPASPGLSRNEVEAIVAS